ncbi:unnamed protein product, partial [Porites evermanni]
AVKESREDVVELKDESISTAALKISSSCSRSPLSYLCCSTMLHLPGNRVCEVDSRLHIRNAVDQIQEGKVDDTVAAKVIGAVRLELVDIREIIKKEYVGTKGFNKYQPLWFYVAGGKCTINESYAEPCGRTGSVEVYDEENNNWTV